MDNNASDLFKNMGSDDDALAESLFSGEGIDDNETDSFMS